MPRIHAYPITVLPASIDALGHVNNQEYVRWMQEAAIAHSAAQGWPLERYLARGQGWLVRRHTVEYLRPAFAGDALVLYTWVAAFARSSSPRRYLFRRARGNAVGFCRHHDRRAGAASRRASRCVRYRRGRRRGVARRHCGVALFDVRDRPPAGFISDP